MDDDLVITNPDIDISEDILKQVIEMMENKKSEMEIGSFLMHQGLTQENATAILKELSVSDTVINIKHQTNNNAIYFLMLFILCFCAHLLLSGYPLINQITGLLTGISGLGILISLFSNIINKK